MCGVSSDGGAAGPARRALAATAGPSWARLRRRAHGRRCAGPRPAPGALGQACARRRGLLGRRRPGPSGVDGGGVAGTAGGVRRRGVASRKAAARSGNGDAVRGGVRGTARARCAIEAACWAACVHRSMSTLRSIVLSLGATMRDTPSRSTVTAPLGSSQATRRVLLL